MNLFISSKNKYPNSSDFEYKAHAFGPTYVNFDKKSSEKAHDYYISACLCYEELAEDDPPQAKSFSLQIDIFTACIFHDHNLV